MAYIREYPPADNCGPMWVKVDKVTPLFFIKKLIRAAELLARKCGALPIKLYLFARALFNFFFFRAALFQATKVFISFEDLITLVVHLHYI